MAAEEMKRLRRLERVILMATESDEEAFSYKHCRSGRSVCLLGLTWQEQWMYGNDRIVPCTMLDWAARCFCGKAHPR